MSFKPAPKARSTKTDATQQTVFDGCLEQKKDYHSDPAIADKEKQDARSQTLRVLNAIKIVSPLLLAALDKSSTDSECAAAFKSLIEWVSSSGNKACQLVGADPALVENFWIRNSFERILAEQAKELWSKGGNNLFVRIDQQMSQIIQAAQQIEMEPFVGDQSSDIKIKLALVRGMSQISARAQSGFDFFRTHQDEDWIRISQLIAGSAVNAVELLAEPKNSAADRATMLALLITEAGAVYANAWRVVGKKMVENLSKLDNKQLEKMLSDSPNGLSLDEVDDVFLLTFERLINLSGKLALPNLGKISQRLAKKTK